MTIQTTEATFDYAALESETRIVVQQRAGEIKERMRRAAQDVIEIGERLQEVKAHLGHGQFGVWLQTEFAWSESAAVKMMQVAERFKSVNFTDLNIGTSALYILAAPSTPEEARNAALTQAANGEQIGYKEAKAIVAEHRLDEKAAPTDDTSDRDVVPVAPQPSPPTSPPVQPAAGAATSLVVSSTGLERVAEAIRRRDNAAAYDAARSSSSSGYDRAMAAVDMMVEGKPIEESLALLAADVQPNVTHQTAQEEDDTEDATWIRNATAEAPAGGRFPQPDRATSDLTVASMEQPTKPREHASAMLSGMIEKLSDQELRMLFMNMFGERPSYGTDIAEEVWQCGLNMLENMTHADIEWLMGTTIEIVTELKP